MAPACAVKMENVTKRFGKVVANNAINLELREGEILSLLGENGSGKTTLMNMLGCLDVPTSGEYWLHGQDVSALTDDELSDIRNREIGFIFQGFNLIPNLTAVENVELPLIYRGVSRSVRQELSREALKKVGLEHRMDHKPSEMSGGQQQRVAIARAIAKNPKLLLCDEPTGALDYNTGKAILKLLQETCRKNGVTVVIITHNLALTPMGDKVIEVKNGRIKNITINKNPVPVERIEW